MESVYLSTWCGRSQDWNFTNRKSLNSNVVRRPLKAAFKNHRCHCTQLTRDAQYGCAADSWTWASVAKYVALRSDKLLCERSSSGCCQRYMWTVLSADGHAAEQQVLCITVHRYYFRMPSSKCTAGRCTRFAGQWMSFQPDDVTPYAQQWMLYC